MKPICVSCHRFYRPKENGFRFIEGMPKSSDVRPKSGLEEPGAWKPYKVWVGDLWECQGCGSEVIVGTGNVPLSEHFRPGFDSHVQDADRGFQVNDC